MKPKTLPIILLLLILATTTYGVVQYIHQPTLPVIVPSQPVHPSQPYQPSEPPVSPKPAPRVITRDDLSQTVTVSAGTPVTVKLGSDQTWDVSWSDPSLLTPIETFAATPGVQGLYTATKAGTTTLSGTGHPICAAGQACPQYLIEFVMTLVITQ